MELRILELPLSGEVGLLHPSAINPYDGSKVVRVLQQLWRTFDITDAEEWRDIRIVNLVGSQATKGMKE
jgi:hypothetical protein